MWRNSTFMTKCYTFIFSILFTFRMVCCADDLQFINDCSCGSEILGWCGRLWTFMAVWWKHWNLFSGKCTYTHFCIQFREIQSLGTNMDSLVLKASMLDEIWNYLALLIHLIQHAWTNTINCTANISALLPFLLLIHPFNKPFINTGL